VLYRDRALRITVKLLRISFEFEFENYLGSLFGDSVKMFDDKKTERNKSRGTVLLRAFSHSTIYLHYRMPVIRSLSTEIILKNFSKE
jgi:hypothetical protein